jgi:chaperonin GroEL
MAKEIKFDEEARRAMRVGIDKLANAIRTTLGPRGRAIVIEQSYGTPMISFDGVTVAKQIDLEDKWENLGANFIKQAAEKTNDGVGDGTSTSTVLAHALIDAGEQQINIKGFNVIQLVEALKKRGAAVIAALEKQKEVIDSPQRVQEVATLSAKSNELGQLVATVMNKVGKDGVVTVGDSQTLEHTYEVVEGLRFDRGYVSPYFVTDPVRMEIVLDNPVILVTDKKIAAIGDIVDLLNQLVKNGQRQILIIADDIEGEALGTLIVNKIRGVANMVPVRAPQFGEKRKQALQDIALVTGAVFISEEAGLKLSEVTLDQLGKAKKVIITKETTTIIDGDGDSDEIKERVSQLKTQIDESTSLYDKQSLQERLGKLSEGVAVIKIGGQTESEQKELKQRVDDAVAATRAAMEEGIVPGGGVALMNIYLTDPMSSSIVNDVVDDTARIIINQALQAPFKAIIENSGVDPMSVTPSSWQGFDAATGKQADLKQAGIVDPLKVVKTAFLSALSVACNYLMMGAAMTIIPEQKDKNVMLPPQ